MLPKAYTKSYRNKKKAYKVAKHSSLLKAATHTLLWATWAYAASLAGSTVAEKDAAAVEEVPCSEVSYAEYILYIRTMTGVPEA